MLTQHAEQVWALVSGLPSPHRQKRWMFVLQAFIDDSGNVGQGATSVLAGYVASTEAWADFSERWAVALAEPPAIPYLHTSNAIALKKEFEGWSTADRDQKLERLVGVINDTDILYGVVAVFHNAGFLKVAGRLFDPFCFLFAQIVMACTIAQRDFKITEKVDFIFDMTSKPAHEIDKAFKWTMFSAPESIKAMGILESPPIFRDDKVFLPLQAADLVASQSRDFFNRQIASPGAKPSWIIDKLGKRGVEMAFLEYDAKDFQFIVDGQRELIEFLKSGPPGEIAERYAQVKALFEQMAASRPPKN